MEQESNNREDASDLGDNLDNRAEPTDAVGEGPDTLKRQTAVRDGAIWIQEAEDVYLSYVDDIARRLSKAAVERKRAEQNSFVDSKHVRAAYSQIVTDRPGRSVFKAASSTAVGIFATALTGMLVHLSTLEAKPESSTIILIAVFALLSIASIGAMVWAHMR